MKKILFAVAGGLWFTYLYAGLLDDVRAGSSEKVANPKVSTVSLYHPLLKNASDR